MQKKRTEWLGGYIRWGKRGPAFIIHRYVDGRRYHISTKCRTEAAALEQLAAFEANPEAYRPGSRGARGPVRPAVVTLTADIITDYVDWMVSRPHNPASQRHADRHFHRLKEWLTVYRGRDIREVPLSEIAEYLHDKRMQTMRIQALKSFCAWLRTTKYLMTRAEDPTLDLKEPPRRATKDYRPVAVPPEHILAVLPHLPPASRDVMVLRLGTGWHNSEVERFASTGRIYDTSGRTIMLMTAQGPQQVPLLAVLKVRHKIGGETNTPILYPEHLAAAKRIQARGRIPNQLTLNRHTSQACAAAGVPRFLNWHLRHSVVSNALQEGADLEHASVFVGHLSVDTTQRHYAQLDLPRKAVPVLRVMGGGKAS